MKEYTKLTAFEYDILRSGHPLERKFEIIKNFVNEIQDEKIELLGEIGCGSGRLSYLLANCYKNYKIESFELNRGFVEYAQEKFKSPNLNFQFLDIEKSKLPEKFDVLVTIDVLHHLKDIKKSIANIQSSLKKEGKWIIIEPNIYNIYIFLFQLLSKNEKLFYQIETEKELLKNFTILNKKYCFFIPFWLKNPPNWLKNLEIKLENKKFIGGSVVYFLKNHLTNSKQATA